MFVDLNFPQRFYNLHYNFYISLFSVIPFITIRVNFICRKKQYSLHSAESSFKLRIPGNVELQLILQALFYSAKLLDKNYNFSTVSCWKMHILRTSNKHWRRTKLPIERRAWFTERNYEWRILWAYRKVYHVYDIPTICNM